MDHPSSSIGWDNYWRLRDYQDTPNYILRAFAEDDGYDDIPTNTRKTDLVAILHRIDRQRLNYRNCDVNELRTFAVQRRLATAPTAAFRSKVKAGNHKQLVRLLETADEFATFHRFLDFSAELRCLVYEHYVASLPRKLQVPAQPPIAKVNKLLRTESLPIFYHGCQFQLNMHSREGKNIKFSDHTQMFISSLSPESLAEIQSLRIVFSTGTNFWQRDYEVDIQLKKSEKGEKPVVKARMMNGQDHVPRGLEKALFDFFNQESQKKKKLAIEDVYAARRKMEGVFVRGGTS